MIDSALSTQHLGLIPSRRSFLSTTGMTLQQKTVYFHDPMDAFMVGEAAGLLPWRRAAEQPRPDDSRKLASLRSPL